VTGFDRDEIWREVEEAVRERFKDRFEVHSNSAVRTITVIGRPPGEEPRSGTPCVEIHDSTFTPCGSGPFRPGREPW
jgi:hypothetical protein